MPTAPTASVYHLIMALPLVALYYGLLIVASILFYNKFDEEKFLDGGSKLVETLSSKGEDLKDNIGEWKDAVYPYIEKYAEVIKEHVGKEHTVEDASPAASLGNTTVYKNVAVLYGKVCDYVEDFSNRNPVVVESVVQLWETLHRYCELVYSYVEDKMVFVSNQEPVKSYLNQYQAFHHEHVTPYIDQTSEVVGTYIDAVYTFLRAKIGEECNNDEITYTFLLVVVGVFILKYTLTRILRVFVKDAFQMKKSVSDMYKQQQMEELRGNAQHSEVYLKIKETTLGDFHMTVDELAEQEQEQETVHLSNDDTTSDNGSNRTFGSNRTTSLDTGSNRSKEEEQEEEEQDKEEALIAEPLHQAAAQSHPPLPLHNQHQSQQSHSEPESSSVPAQETPTTPLSLQHGLLPPVPAIQPSRASSSTTAVTVSVSPPEQAKDRDHTSVRSLLL